MSSIQSFIMKKLLQILSPGSYAYDNIIDKKVSMEEFEETTETLSKVRIGDIILTKTPNLMHQIGRKFVSSEYDHVSVVINETQGIHISPPQISKMSLKYLLLPSQSPLVLRLNWSSEVIKQFVQLLHSFIGQRYDYLALFNLIKEEMKGVFSSSDKFIFSLNQLKYHKICTNIIVYCLAKANKEIEGQLRNHPKSYQFSKIGAFLPDDIINMLSKTQSSYIVHQTKLSAVDQPSPATKIVALSTMFSLSRVNFFSKISSQILSLTRKIVNIPKSDVKKYQKYLSILRIFYSISSALNPIAKIHGIVKLVLLVFETTRFIGPKINPKKPKPKL